MSTSDQPASNSLFPPCPTCGAAEPGACQKVEKQACALLLAHNKHYVCRCCAAWVGDPHDRYCKLAQGVVTMEFATDTPIDFPAELPRGVDEIGPGGMSLLTFPERRIVRRKNADEFMAATDDQKRRIFQVCAEDAEDVACMYSLRMQATYPNVVPELSMLVRRLAYALEQATPGHVLAAEAMTYLVDERMLGKLPVVLNPDATAQADS